MNETKPKYFRLLEQGEQYVKDRDFYCTPKGVIERLNHGHQVPFDDHIFRPVQVDEWVSYAERKPTEEDFEPTGEIQVMFADTKRPPTTTQSWDYHKYDKQTYLRKISHWRRTTPPEQPKPKSVKLNMSDQVRVAIFQKDGSVKLDCGTTIYAESVDEFIRVRKEAMEQ